MKSTFASDVHARVKLMDEQGIHAKIAYTNIHGFGGQRGMGVIAYLRLESIRIFNDAMADMQRDSSQRVFPMVLLRWWDINASRRNRRCIKLGFKGININSDPHHGVPSLGVAHWDTLLRMRGSNGFPLNFHSGASETSTS